MGATTAAACGARDVPKPAGPAEDEDDRPRVPHWVADAVASHPSAVIAFCLANHPSLNNGRCSGGVTGAGLANDGVTGIVAVCSESGKPDFKAISVAQTRIACSCNCLLAINTWSQTASVKPLRRCSGKYFTSQRIDFRARNMSYGGAFTGMTDEEGGTAPAGRLSRLPRSSAVPKLRGP